MRWRWVASQPWGRTLVAHAGRLQEGRQNLGEGWWQSWHTLWPPRCMEKATIPPWRTPALRGSCRLSTYAPPQPDDLPVCMPPASLAPPTSCPFSFPTLHSTPTHVSCFSCGRRPCLHPLQYLLTARDSARPATRCIWVCKWAVQALPWLLACKTEYFLSALKHSTTSLCFPKTSELSHIIIFLPLFQLFLELCPGSSCGISIPEVGLGIQD